MHQQQTTMMSLSLWSWGNLDRSFEATALTVDSGATGVLIAHKEQPALEGLCEDKDEARAKKGGGE